MLLLLFHSSIHIKSHKCYEIEITFGKKSGRRGKGGEKSECEKKRNLDE
jgi:hypothetical protein